MRVKCLLGVAFAALGILSISSGQLFACNDETCMPYRGNGRDGFDYEEINNCPEGGCYIEKRPAGGECRGPFDYADGQLCFNVTVYTPFWYMYTEDCEPECDYSNSFWQESPVYISVPTCNSAVPCDNTRYNWE